MGLNKFVFNEFGDAKDHRFEFINGFKALYSDVRRGEFEKYTIILKRPHSSTYIHLEDEGEAWDTINNHLDNYDSYVIQDERLAQYLTSEEGKWGRQDSFDNSINFNK